MAKKRSSGKRRPVPKTVLRLPDLDQAKSAVLNSLRSHDAQRSYRHAIDPDHPDGQVSIRFGGFIGTIHTGA
jgi:hypothetical protein